MMRTLFRLHCVQIMTIAKTTTPAEPLTGLSTIHSVEIPLSI